MKNAWGLIILVMIIVASPVSTFARLGETKAECQQRYGNPEQLLSNTVVYGFTQDIPIESLYGETTPILEGAETIAYRYNNWLIKIAFVNGKAVRIVYLKYSRYGTTPLEITAMEEDAILVAEGWTTDDTGSWRNTNGNTARHQDNCISRRILVVETPEAEAFIKAQQDKEEQWLKDSLPKF